jgi:Na+-driven multidrug efflux pump
MKSIEKDKKLHKTFRRYLIPSVAATLLIAGNYLVDSIVVGLRLGEQALAALNIGVPVTGFLYALGYLFAYGASNHFTSLNGAGKPEEAKTYYATGLWTLAGSSILILILGLCFNEQISFFLSGKSALAPYTEEYLKYVFLFAPFYCLETFFVVFVRNDHAPLFSMIGTFTTCSTNIVLDILFVWVLDGGMKGASMATGMALVAGFIVVFIKNIRKK